MLHISIFRNYINKEFTMDLDFGYSVERVIDDLVFMCFFVGNDFLPKLPTMDIREKSLDSVFMSYKEVPHCKYCQCVQNALVLAASCV